jgi:serine/threonine-protein kinase
MPDLSARLSAALVDRYRIDRKLGAGGMALVFLAEDLKHHRPVALKVLRLELTAVLGMERFLREIAIAANLTHPHILSLHDSGEADGILYYVMPYVEGESLRDRLNREPVQPLSRALKIGQAVAAALDYAHRHGVVHRDIKPENILLQGDEPLVADFGIARALSEAGGDRLTSTGLTLGTPSYMSPEQAAGTRDVDGRSDIYSLGCVLYEMVAGQPPFRGPSARAVIGAHIATPPPPFEAGVQVSVEAERAIRKALAKEPEERYATAAEFAAALEPGSTPAPPHRHFARRALTLVALAAAIALTVGGVILSRRRHAAAYNSNLLAVAPFDVLDPKLTLWREGLVDVLSSNFDGVGLLHTVSPSVVLRRWEGRADPASATSLGRRTGARLNVYGRLLTSGADSVRATASILDAQEGKVLAQVETRDVAERMDRVADTLTSQLLRELARVQPMGAVRLTSLGTRSLPALRAYLQGEQFYRRTAWDSALAYYGNAARIDPGFALALRRSSQVITWQMPNGDSLARALAMRAAGNNHGLSPRDSLLVSADSLFFAMLDFDADPFWWNHSRRLGELLHRLTELYPDDPEGWFMLGELRHHFGYGVGTTYDQALEAFARAVATDSAYAPAYIHPVEEALSLGQTEVARRYLRGYLALKPTDFFRDGLELTEALMDPARAASPEIAQRLDTIAADPLYVGLFATYRWGDSLATAVRLGRLLAAGRHAAVPIFAEPAFGRSKLAYALAWHGRLREAFTIARLEVPELFADYAELGIFPTDSAEAVFQNWIGGDPGKVRLALWWWAGRRDTLQLQRFLARAPATTAADRQRATALGHVALALARGDSVNALARLLAFPDSLCPGCYDIRLRRARLLAGAGRDREAADLLAAMPPYDPTPSQVLGILLEGHVAERLRETARAERAYRIVTEIWRDADPELRALLGEAHDGLARLDQRR